MAGNEQAPRVNGGPDEQQSESHHSSREALSDAEIRDLGFEVHRGWHKVVVNGDEQWWGPGHWDCTEDGVRDRMAEAEERRRYTDRPAFRIPGPSVECSVCDEEADPSTVGTPTCSEICSAVLMHQIVDAIAEHLFTQPDGSGGTDPVHPITPARSRKRPSGLPTGRLSVERALERLGSCQNVLEGHSVRVRGRTAYCPFHANERTPAMSLYEKNGKSRAHCHSCGWDGDPIDLEAARTDEDLATTIRRTS